MSPYLMAHPDVAFFVQIGFGLANIDFILFGLFILPYYLNRRFDPIFGPKEGEEWELNKSPGAPYYFFDKARDYCKAILYDDFAAKKFNSNSEFCRRQIHPLFIYACRFYMFSERFLFAWWVGLTILLFSGK